MILDTDRDRELRDLIEDCIHYAGDQSFACHLAAYVTERYQDETTIDTTN